MIGSVLYNALGFKLTFFVFGIAKVLFAVSLRLWVPDRRQVAQVQSESTEVELLQREKVVD